MKEKGGTISEGIKEGVISIGFLDLCPRID